MDCKHHPDSNKNSRSIASNTNTIICGVCGTKQYFKTCLHNDFPDPVCIPNPEWHPCADAFGKNYSRIEPLLSGPSLMNPLCANANVFHSHSSMGVKLMPTSTPCLSKETQDLKEPIHNSKSSMNQSIRKGKTRPGGRPKSRAGYESLEKVNEMNAQPQFVGEPNVCPIQFQQNCWANYCRFVPCTYQPLAVPVPHYIPVYIPVGSDVESNCDHTANSSSQTETVLKEDNKNESDDDYEEVAKKLVQGFDSDEDTNLDEFVNRFDADDKILMKSEENDLNGVEAVPNRNEFDSNEENDKDEWSSNENYPDKGDDWTRGGVETEMDERPVSGSKKNEEDNRGCNENYMYENLRDVVALAERKIDSDFEESTLIAPSTPIKMSLNEYDYDMEKSGGNGDSQTESVTESEGSKNSKTRSNDSRLNFKPDLEQDDVDRIMDTLEGIKSSKEDSHENLNITKQDERSEENNDSDNNDEKFENSTDIALDPKKSYHNDNEDVYKIINVYKKVSNEDGKEDWLDTEEEILSYVRKDSYDNLPLKIQKESELVSNNRNAITQYIDKNTQDEEDEDFLNIKKRPERKEDCQKKCKESFYSPRASAKIQNVQDQGSNTQGEKPKSVTNKLIYTAIINKKEEKEKDASPFNSPRWRDESKRNGKRQEAKKRWMI